MNDLFFERRRHRLTTELNQMEKNIQEIMEQLKKINGSPNFFQLLLDLQQEFERFRSSLESDPVQKGIIGFGGGFSAGKSSLLNAIIGRKLLPTGIDPTSAVPVYLFYGKKEKVEVISTSGKRVPLALNEFIILTHDFEKNNGKFDKNTLEAAHISLSDFHWQNLVLLDTPGYSKSEGEKKSMDAKIAQKQLNNVHIIVWMIPSIEGTITESDLRFLSGLNSNIPKLFVLSQADLKTEKDILSIQNLIRKILEQRKIEFLDIIPFSAKNKQYSISRITQWIDQWNKQELGMSFSENFEAIFTNIYNYFNKIDLSKSNLLDKYSWPYCFVRLSSTFFFHLEEISEMFGESISEPSFFT